MPARHPLSLCSALAAVNACRASSELVVTCSIGTSNFFTVASDSPNSPRSVEAASPSALSTFSLPLAVTCSCANGSPLWQFTALSSMTYSLPKLVIEPSMYALLPARWHKSRATSVVSFVFAGRVISFSVSLTLLSDSTFRKGDWFNPTVKPVLVGDTDIDPLRGLVLPCRQGFT